MRPSCLESLWCRGRRGFHPGPLPWAETGCLPVWRIEGGEQGREAEEHPPLPPEGCVLLLGPGCWQLAVFFIFETWLIVSG